jgi:hypothetical protein
MLSRAQRDRNNAADRARKRDESTDVRAARLAKNNMIHKAWRTAWKGQESSESRVERLAKDAAKTKARRLKAQENESEEAAVKRRAGNKRANDARIARETDADRVKRLASNKPHKLANARKRRLDPLCVLEDRLKSRVRQLMRSKGYKKTARAQELLGCSWEHALQHLQNNPRGLNVLDKGTHIDHIKPFTAFSNLQCPVQQRLVNHWSNLQLLTAEENLKKSGSHDHATWSVSEPGIKLLAFERELRAAAANNDAAVVYVDDSSDDDEFSDDE